MASQLKLSLLVGFGGIKAVDTEFPYWVPIVDRGAIAVPLLADPISDSYCKKEKGHQNRGPSLLESQVFFLEILERRLEPPGASIRAPQSLD